MPATAYSILQLQRTIGNQAAQRLLRSSYLQAKLSISHPGDIYEQEADRVAEQVMRMPAPTLQRACAPCAAGGAPYRMPSPLTDKTVGEVEVGHTDCDWDRAVKPDEPFKPRSGKPKVTIGGDKCTLPCTIEHEAAHVVQVQPICEGYYNCYTGAPAKAKEEAECKGMTKSEERKKCEDLYTQYYRLQCFVDVSDAWDAETWECEAYKKSLACAEKKMGKAEKDCHSKLKEYKESAQKQIVKYCKPGEEKKEEHKEPEGSKKPEEPKRPPREPEVKPEKPKEVVLRDGTLQRSVVTGAGEEPDALPPIVYDVLRSPGQPLDPATRAFFEPRFGYDFGAVRVHTNAQAAESARAVNALAYTVRGDVVFGPGQYTPGTSEGQRLLVHELTHVIQQGQAQPTKMSSIPLARAQQALMPYRPNASVNFGACDGGGLVEEPFNFKKDKDTKPWIEKITVDFNGTATDSGGDLVPTGDLTATYFANKVKLADITVTVVGGKASEGLTDKGGHTVTRIEGCGYHHTGVSDKTKRVSSKWPGFKYWQPAFIANATMNFAVFFVEGKKTGNQAIHEGSLSTGSLACVHVSNRDTIRRINYHSVEGHTKVDVSYSAAALKDLCCERLKAKGFMVSNPCKGQDPKKCP